MKANPDWQVTVQSAEYLPQSPDFIPGYVQIDDITDGKNHWSKSPEKLRAEGITVPDFSRLPSGRYTWGNACFMLKYTALVAVANAANEFLQFDYIERCDMRASLVSSLADLTELGWKAGAK